MTTAFKRRRGLHVPVQLLLGLASLAVITFVCFRLGFDVTAAAFAYIILLALVSLLGSFSASVILSVIAAACLNYFFAPPLFELRIDVLDDAAAIAGFLITSLVVTAVTAKLRVSEARFRTFVDHATDAFLLLDEDWTVLDVNRRACDSLGYNREELIGRHKSDFDVGLDDTSIQGLKQRVLAGDAVSFETRHRRKDGTSFPVEVRISQFEQGGRRFLCLVRDITERKGAEDELRASEERFRTLVQFSFDVYWESDAQHRFTRQEFAEGLEDTPAPGSEIGKTRWEIPYLEPDEEAWRKHRETLDAHLPFRDFELARPTPDGGKRYVSVSGLPVFDKTGSFIGYRGVGRHITERKKAEEALRRSEAYLAEAQRLSHTGTVVFNASGPLYWSEESYRIWGLDPLQGLPSLETVLRRRVPGGGGAAGASRGRVLRGLPAGQRGADGACAVADPAGRGRGHLAAGPGDRPGRGPPDAPPAGRCHRRRGRDRPRRPLHQAGPGRRSGPGRAGRLLQPHGRSAGGESARRRPVRRGRQPCSSGHR